MSDFLSSTRFQDDLETVHEPKSRLNELLLCLFV